MSAGHAHSRPNEKHPIELKKIEADPDFQRMWARPFRVTTTRQIPDSAGYSVMGDEYFIDVDLYKAVLAGSWTDPKTGQTSSIRVPGLTPQQVVQCLLKHERTEKTILDSDNPINEYEPAHEFATLAEHLQVKEFGARPVDYERVIAPIIAWNQLKTLNNVPPNLSCAPLLDNQDGQDKITIKALQKLGIKDSFKLPKKNVRYGPASGPDHCSACVNWLSASRQVELSPCRKVDGAIRNSYWCMRYEDVNAADQGRKAGENTGLAISQSGQGQGIPEAQQGTPQG